MLAGSARGWATSRSSPSINARPRPSTGGGAAGWGDLSAHWDASSFETALGAPAGAEERSRLVAALIDSFFRGYRDVARGSDEAFIPLDEGLAVVSRHARDLGYDGLVLFLDELILWLATHAADLRFLNEEGPKVSKLVEAGDGRPADPDRQLRCAPARPARAGRRAGDGRVAARLRGRAAMVGGPLRADHAGGPQPPGDRLRGACCARGTRRRASRSIAPTPTPRRFAGRCSRPC